MKIINPSSEIISYTSDLEKIIELAGRTCYKSEDRITKDSAKEFIQKIKNFKHESVLEHGSITVKFIVDRGISHELVRHRLASFSQESTRYCCYSKQKFNNEITVIKPFFWEEASDQYQRWLESMEEVEENYFDLLQLGASAQEARTVLPNSLKTEVVVTANPREWLHIFNVRCHRDAHPQMREVMLPLEEQFVQKWPSIFFEGKS